MKKIIQSFALFVALISASYAQSANYYAYFINNSKSKMISVSTVNSHFWNHPGWAPCSAGIDYLKPGKTAVKCGGTGNEVNAYTTYSVIVNASGDDINSPVIYHGLNRVSVTSYSNAYLYVTSRDSNNNEVAMMHKPTNTTDDKDMVILYVFDDVGFSITTLRYDLGDALQYINSKNFDLIKHRCTDDNDPYNTIGCTYYQRYSIWNG